MFVKEKRNYSSKLIEDYSSFFLHPIKTLSLGFSIMFWPVFVMYLFYLAILTNFFTPFYNTLNNTEMTILAIVVFISVIIFSIWTFFPKMFCLIRFWIVTFKNIRKVPLMKIKCSQAKILLKNIDEFYAGNIHILDRTKGIVDDYYGVNSLLGFWSKNQNEEIVFVGDFLSTILLINASYIYQVKEKINEYGKKKGVKILQKKKDKEIFNTELKRNREDSLNILISTIKKMEKDSNNYINSGINMINEVIKND